MVKILLLDDERNALEMLTDVVAEQMPAAELHGFRKPSEALEWAQDNAPIEVAFLDIQMRGMNGLEVARQLKEYSPRVNIIFTTGYSEYAVEACNLQVSGYLLKPVNAEKVRTALDSLLYPAEKKHVGVYVSTFGEFDVLVNGKSIRFGRSKSREMLAYLVDRRGSAVSRKEIFAVLFADDEYDHAKQAYLTNIIRDLQNSLEAAGIANMLVRRYNSYAVDVKTFGCDLYDYDKGDPMAINAFHGEYMTRYDWAEPTLAALYRKR